MRKCKIWQCKRMCVLYAYMGKCLNPFTMDCFLFSHPNITDIMIPLYYLMPFNLISLIKDRMLYCFGFYQRMLNLNWCTFGDFTDQNKFKCILKSTWINLLKLFEFISLNHISFLYTYQYTFEDEESNSSNKNVSRFSSATLLRTAT